jgi:hypothetical protein
VVPFQKPPDCGVACQQFVPVETIMLPARNNDELVGHPGLLQSRAQPRCLAVGDDVVILTKNGEDRRQRGADMVDRRESVQSNIVESLGFPFKSGALRLVVHRNHIDMSISFSVICSSIPAVFAAS